MEVKTYNIGQAVYLVTDSDQNLRMVLEILITPNGVRYCVGMGTQTSWHYPIELSDTKNELLSMGVGDSLNYN